MSGWLGRSLFLALCALFIAVVVLLAGSVFYAGHLLVVDTVPRAADVGVVLAGDFARAMFAADLYHQGLIPMVWITRPIRERALAQLDLLGIPYPRQEEVSRTVLLKRGVPEKSIEFIGDGLVNTLAEAKSVAHVLETRPEIRSVLIVTNRAHVRRAQAIFGHVLVRAPQVSVLVVGTPYDGFTADRWWKDRDSARQVVLETAKLVFFWIATEF